MALEANNAIVTLDDARLYLGKGSTDTGDDQLIDMLAQHASVMIARELGTASVVSCSYKEYRDGHGGPNIWLNNYPVTSVDLVSVDRDDVFTLEYTGSDASYATAEVTTTQLKLRKRVNGVVTATSLTLTDYATMTALETAVEAVSGWTMTVESTLASYSPTSLCPVPARNARDAAVTFGVPDEGETEYELSGNNGKLYNPYGWNVGHNNVYVEYTAGYVRAEIPQPIRASCLELIALLYNLAKKDASLKSEKIGEYQYTMADRLDALFSGSGEGAVSNTLNVKLAPYRRITRGGA
mgnify:FL=1